MPAHGAKRHLMVPGGPPFAKASARQAIHGGKRQIMVGRLCSGENDHPPRPLLISQHGVRLMVLDSEVHRFRSCNPERGTQNPEPLFEHPGPGLEAPDFVGSVAA